MKYIILLSLGFSVSAFSQDHQAILKDFKAINEINGSTFNYKACASDDPNAPAYCKNLYKYICSLKKITNKRERLEQKLMKDHWEKIPQPVTYKAFNDMARRVQQISENSVEDLTGLSKKDIQNAMKDVKSSLHNFISSTPLIHKDYKKGMIEKTGNVKLIYGPDFVDTLVQYGLENAPGYPEEQVRAQANQLYMSSCGTNGLEVNAFYQGGNLVLCPGLIISAAEYGGTKKEVLSALKFTIGHEVGHAIDVGAYPHTYRKMKTCYQDVSKNEDIFNEMGAEITADYWGALALGDKLNSKNPEDNARIIALSVDGFCSPAVEGTPHPEGEFRINQSIAKHPYIARALNCAPAESDAPYCSINGAYSP